MENEPKHVLTLRIDRKLRKQLEAMAELQDRTLSATIIHLIRVGLGLSAPLTSMESVPSRQRKSA
jgi:hypothetical protein